MIERKKFRLVGTKHLYELTYRRDDDVFAGVIRPGTLHDGLRHMFDIILSLGTL